MTAKEFAVKIICHLNKADALKENDLLIFTSLGVISGILYQHNEELDDNADLLFSAMFISFDKNLPEFDVSGVANDVFIPLKNVTLTLQSGQQLHYPVFAVFVDQIIGISLLGRNQK